MNMLLTIQVIPGVVCTSFSDAVDATWKYMSKVEEHCCCISTFHGLCKLRLPATTYSMQRTVGLKRRKAHKKPEPTHPNRAVVPQKH